MTVSDCAKCLQETVHGNSFCAHAYVIKILNADKVMWDKFREDCHNQDFEIKEIYMLTGNESKDRIIIAGVLHKIEAVLWLKISVSDIIYEFEQLKKKKT